MTGGGTSVGLKGVLMSNPIPLVHAFKPPRLFAISFENRLQLGKKIWKYPISIFSQSFKIQKGTKHEGPSEPVCVA